MKAEGLGWKNELRLSCFVSACERVKYKLFVILPNDLWHLYASGAHTALDKWSKILFSRLPIHLTLTWLHKYLQRPLNMFYLNSTLYSQHVITIDQIVCQQRSMIWSVDHQKPSASITVPGPIQQSPLERRPARHCINARHTSRTPFKTYSLFKHTKGIRPVLLRRAYGAENVTACFSQHRRARATRRVGDSPDVQIVRDGAARHRRQQTMWPPPARSASYPPAAVFRSFVAKSPPPKGGNCNETCRRKTIQRDCAARPSFAARRYIHLHEARPARPPVRPYIIIRVVHPRSFDFERRQ